MRYQVSLTVDVHSTRFEDIEQACLDAARAAAREAMVGLCRGLETSRGPRARKARHGRRRTLLTRAGYITITRGRARRPDGARYFPLDEGLGLASHHEASSAVRRRGCHLAAEHPYRGRRPGCSRRRSAPPSITGPCGGGSRQRATRCSRPERSE